VRVIFKRFQINPLKLVAAPLAQISVLLTYIVATRDLLSNGALDLSNQGMLWFTDLSARDPTLILPLAAAYCTYSSLELSMGRTPPPADPSKPPQIAMTDIVREVMQSVLVFSVPMIAQLPAGIFMYWIPSSLFGISQTLALRSNRIRGAVGLPLLQKRLPPRKIARANLPLVFKNPPSKPGSEVGASKAAEPPRSG